MTYEVEIRATEHTYLFEVREAVPDGRSCIVSYAYVRSRARSLVLNPADAREWCMGHAAELIDDLS